MSLKAALAGTTIYRIGNVAVMFLLTVVLSRAMGAAGYGLLSLLILNGSLFNLFTSFGTDSGVTYSVAQDSGSLNGVVSLTFMIVAVQVLLLCIIELILFAATGHWWLANAAGGQALLLGVLFLLSLSLLEKCTALLNGSHLYVLCNKTIFFGNLASLVFISIFYLVRKGDVAFFIVLFVLVNFLQALLLTIVAMRRLSFSFQPNFSKDALQFFFRYSALAFFINCIQFLAYRVDFWLIDYYSSEGELGWYALAVRLAQLFWILPVLFSSILLPKLSSATVEKEEWLPLVRLLNTINALAGIALFVCIKPLIILLFGSTYTASVPAFQLLLPGVVLFVNAIILAAYFASQNQLKVNLIGSLFCLLLVGAFDLILIPSKGYLGAAIASSIGYGLTTVYFLFVYHKKTGYSIQALFIVQKDDWQQLRFWGKQITSKQA